MRTMPCNKLHVALQAVSHATAIFSQQRCRRLKIDDSRSVCKYRLVKQSTLVALWTPDVCTWPCPSCWFSRGTPIKLSLTSCTYTILMQPNLLWVTAENSPPKNPGNILSEMVSKERRNGRIRQSSPPGVPQISFLLYHLLHHWAEHSWEKHILCTQHHSGLVWMLAPYIDSTLPGVDLVCSTALNCGQSPTPN